MYTEAEAREAREDGIDLLEEARLLALSRSAIYQQGMRHYHSMKIKPLAFREGNLVLRIVQEQADQHKLSPPLEGPFIMSRALRDRNAYYLVDFLRENRDIFAWTPKDMPGIPRKYAEHKLHVRKDAKPSIPRRLSKEKRRTIGEEVAKLLAASFIMEVFHPEWLDNPVLVLKKNKTWRMCIDYTSLNKACPKDPSPSRGSTKSSTRPPGASCCPSWTPTPAITRSSWTRPMP